ncbi:MAG: isoaspartyl peptidase/L-asparaginase [Planctomycetota bacterium]
MNSISAEMPDENRNARWAIVLHGGADGDSKRFVPEVRKARLSGMERALDEGVRRLRDGEAAMDVVEAVVRILEDNPVFNAGRGAVRTSEDRFELDAAIMNGQTRKCGAVAGVGNCAHPITLARRVMKKTRHVLLVDEGAEAFADAEDLGGTPQSYFRLPTGAGENDGAMAIPKAGALHTDTHYGTVGCAVLDVHGNLAAGTSTGGLRNKMPGRTGDSPIIGAGTYADNRSCACSGTGIGEEFIRTSAAYDVSAQMRYAGRSLSESVDNLIDETLPDKCGGLIAVDRNGNIAIRHNTDSIAAAMATSDGQRKIGFEYPKTQP